jgi:two-component system response regulator GlrR
MNFGGLNLIGRADSFLRALALLARYASCDACVLIQGETGTGKELAARAVHYLSRRRSHPFVPVNCGGIPESLVESEFFGHVRGAFTDAKEARSGVIAQALGGTLFLDEIDALSPRSQVAILRFLQDHEYRPVGGAKSCRADVRIIACTNADIAALVEDGRYRRDLFYRLNVLAVHLPPLRERPGDAQLLAEALVQRLNHQYGETKVLHTDILAFIADYPWPGNVRELENLVHREYLLADSPAISVTHTRGLDADEHRAAVASPFTDCGFQQAKARVIAEFERAYLTELLTRTRGNISRAARLAGKERSRFGKLARKHGLVRNGFRSGSVEDENLSTMMHTER